MLAAGLLLLVVVGVGVAWSALRAPLSRDETRRADLRRITTALERHRARHGSFPPDVSPAVAAAGGVDGCVSSALRDLRRIPEDPLFTGGYVHPGEGQHCYYYRRVGAGYVLYARLELPWGSPSPCDPADLYRPQLHGFDVCILKNQPPRPAVSARTRLRGLGFGTVFLPLGVISLALAVRGWRRAGATGPTPEAKDRFAAAIVLAGGVAAFHAMTAGLLDWYYGHFLPHYDSIGTYRDMARIVWLARGPEWEAAARYAFALSLGWLAPVFALVTAPFVRPHPAGFQLLNTVLLAGFALAVATAARVLGASRSRAAAISLVVLLPDALMNWDGGYQDFKRDSQFLPLLGATWFLTFAQAWEPRRARGVLLGIAAGLTVWSRGEAIVYMAVVLGPVIAALGWREGARRVVAALAAPAAVALVIAVPFLWASAPEILARRAALTESFGTGVSPWASLRYYWSAPFHLWSTTEPLIRATPSGLGLALGQTALLLGASLALFGRPARRAPAAREWTLAAAGAFALVATVLVLTFGARWTPGFGWAGYPPFYPALLGPFSWAVVVLLRATGDAAPRRAASRWVGVATLAAVSIGFVGLRMWLRAPLHEEPVATARRIARTIRESKDAPVVAVLTHDRINVHTLLFMNALDGYDPGREMRPFLWRPPDADWKDTGYRLPAGAPVEPVQRALLQQLQKGSDWVIVNAEPASYAGPPNPWEFFLFRHGRPVVEAVLGDHRFERVDSFVITSPGSTREFLVLHNRRAARGSRRPARTAQAPE